QSQRADPAQASDRQPHHNRAARARGSRGGGQDTGAQPLRARRRSLHHGCHVDRGCAKEFFRRNRGGPRSHDDLRKVSVGWVERRVNSSYAGAMMMMTAAKLTRSGYLGLAWCNYRRFSIFLTSASIAGSVLRTTIAYPAGVKCQLVLLGT